MMYGSMNTKIVLGLVIQKYYLYIQIGLEYDCVTMILILGIYFRSASLFSAVIIK